MKSVLLYNIIRFVAWPESVVAPEWRLCFIGEDGFGQQLEELVGKKIQQRELTLLRNISIEQIPVCHLLFIAGSERDRLTSLLSLTQAHPILTVADTPNFAQYGVMFNLIKSPAGVAEQDQYIQIEINAQRAKVLGFTIHARLLNLAHIVDSF